MRSPFLPASAMIARATGNFGSSWLTAAIARYPWGMSNSSRSVTPIFSLSVLLVSFNLPAMSSRKSLSAGSFQSCPYWLCRNDSRSVLMSATLTRKTVESGRTRSGGVAAWARFAVSPEKPLRPSHPTRARRRIARFAIRITLTLQSRHSAAHRPWERKLTADTPGRRRQWLSRLRAWNVADGDRRASSLVHQLVPGRTPTHP